MQTFGWAGLTAVCEVRGMQLHRLTLNVDDEMLMTLNVGLEVLGDSFCVSQLLWVFLLE